MISFERYAALFAQRDLTRTFAASVVGRLPIGLTGLAVLLLVQTSSGSFARGGAAAGCYVAGLAAVAPAIGRIIDRYGSRPGKSALPRMPPKPPTRPLPACCWG